MKTSLSRTLWLFAVLLLSAGLCAGGCRGESRMEGASTPAASQAAPAPTPAPAPVQSSHSAAPAAEPAQLPPGHPPISAQSAPAAPASGGELTWTAPAGWVSTPPSNNMRRAQYRVPAATGDAELVVFYFGPGQGGDAQSNADRWASQFLDEKGQPATAKTRPFQSNGVPVTVVEARGTYQSGGMTGGTVEEKPGYALLGAIAAGADANWFFKLTGPEATVEAQRAAFDSLLQSLRPAG
jgi:hypothetical protein